MPPTVQEALAAEYHTRTEQLTAVIEQLKVEREGSQQAFDKYRLVCKMISIIISFNFII
jgi:hypothetical protein